MSTRSSYTLTELLVHATSADVYRAIRNADGHPVVLKILDRRRSRPKDLENLKREFELGSLFDTDAVVRPLALETYEGMPALILEDYGGRPLAELLGAPIAVDRFLPMAIGMARALAKIHERGVIHKDLKPSNILVDPASGVVTIHDFGLASRLPRVHQPSQPPRLIEGSLPYIAPEQTGRTNRAVDNRADLYSLGVTFHEMLTGQLPFQANDPVEWVHCHVAQTPPKASEIVAGIPEGIACIVLKLLSKVPEDRYQSARGVQRDLERCLGEWRSTGGVEPFLLGEHDVHERLQIPQRLYGRKAEMSLLQDALARVAGSGTPELLLVSGYSGIGKTSLVHELEAPALAKQGSFVSGKFDPQRRDVPYATLVHAVRDLVLWILGESDDKLGRLRQQLLEALAINAQLIVDVIPELALVIGRQTPPPELPPVEARNRFRLVFWHFIARLARKEHPLVLFLDDLQWADSASLDLLEEFFGHSERCYLLLIGAYRANEVSPSHPLMLMLDRVRRAGAPVQDVVLGPIPRDDFAGFVGDALRCGREDALPLAELIYDRTAGNPFFAIQFLLSLHDEGLVALDPRGGRFRWDLERIRRKGLTDNVVDLVVGMLKKFSTATQDSLKLLACLGDKADLTLLALTSGGSEEDVHRNLCAAGDAGLVLRVADTYRFLHDRVQEAAYSLVPEDERAALHLRIGRTLLSQLPKDKIEERVFDVVNQLNRGAMLLTNPVERESLSHLNYLAGTKAKASTAYASAQRYLAQAARLLPSDAWSTRYDETLALHLALCECEFLIGDFDCADQRLDRVLENAHGPLDRAKAYLLRVSLYPISGRFGDVVKVMVEALRLFDIEFPESGPELKAATESEIQAVWANLGEGRIADVVDAPLLTDPSIQIVMAILAKSLPMVYIVWPDHFPLVNARAVNLSLRYGNSAESCHVYSSFGVVLMSSPDDLPAGFEFCEMSLRLSEKLDDRKYRGAVLFIRGNHNFWCRHFSDDARLLDRAFSACLEAGDLACAGYVAWIFPWHAVENGEPLDEVLKCCNKYGTFAKESGGVLYVKALGLVWQFVASLKGVTLPAPSFDSDHFEEGAWVSALEGGAFYLALTLHYVMKQCIAFLYGRYEEALGFAVSAAAATGETLSQAYIPTMSLYHALSVAALYADAPPERQKDLRLALEQERRKLERWAGYCPANFQNRHALVSAEIARIEGRETDAMRLYEEAIQSARHNGFVHNEAIAYECASRFYRARRFEEFADAYLREARACYARWGADGKVRQIDAEYPRLVEPKVLSPALTFAAGPERLDVLSVTKASQMISGEIVRDKLVRTLLHIVLEHAGATRGCLVVCRDGRLAIEAEATLEENGVATNILGSIPVDGSSRAPASLLQYVHRTKEGVVLGDSAADAAKFPGDDYFAHGRPKSMVCMPVVRQAEVVGLLYLENTLVAGAFTAERLAALAVLAGQAAISLENAMLLAEERAARAAAEKAQAAAEEAEHRAAFLAEAGALLSESLDTEQTFGRLGQLCVRSLGDWCAVDLVQGEDMRRIAVAHRNPAMDAVLRELQRRYPLRPYSPHPGAQVLRTGEAVLMPEITDDMLRAICHDEEHLRLARTLGTMSGISVPLVARGQMLGVLSLAAASPRQPYGRADMELVQEVARRAAVAIDNAGLYRASQEAVRARSEFLSVASHELNTPVTSLTLSVQSMRRAAASGRPMDTRAMERQLDLVCRQAARLTKLTADLLDVTRLEVEHRPLERTVVDLGVLAREVLSRFEGDVARAGCSVSLIADGPVVGRWDRSRIDRVITNLLSNAIKFGAGKPIEVFVGSDGRIARLTIRDHGIGIGREENERIFGRFERAVSERHYGGLGLGLYICRQIVEEHGGSIRGEGAPGEGAKFTVQLPCVQPDQRGK